MHQHRCQDHMWQADQKGFLQAFSSATCGCNQAPLKADSCEVTFTHRPRLTGYVRSSNGGTSDMVRKMFPQDWCRQNQALCLAVQPPGRNLRLKEACITSAQEMAQAVFEVVAHKLVQQPYVVSIGTVVRNRAEGLSRDWSAASGLPNS